MAERQPPQNFAGIEILKFSGGIFASYFIGGEFFQRSLDRQPAETDTPRREADYRDSAPRREALNSPDSQTEPICDFFLG